MAYVTDDKRVKEIVKAVKRGTFPITEGMKKVRELGFLEWEAKEAFVINT